MVDWKTVFITAIIVVVLVVIIALHVRASHPQMFAAYCDKAQESLHCDCARTEASRVGYADSLPLCPDRYVGQTPFGDPRGPRACRSPMYNPFWPPYGAAGEYKTPGGVVDIPISRMIGDHVPPE
jgi:hypothetical protein